MFAESLTLTSSIINAMVTTTNTNYDVIIIGGGATGAGTARDCAKRGLKVLLVERHDIATGATSRNHGLLHSGARYAVNDSESARECIKENMILRKVARHCVEQTDGLFISLPEDGLEFQSKFVDSCLAAGIQAQVIDPKEALRMEPAANPALIGAVKVPDGAVDPFRLTAANILDARIHGATILTYHEVLTILKEQGRVIGVEVYDEKTHEKRSYYAPVTVNAGGIWGHLIAEKAGVTVNMYPAKGSLLIFGHRVNSIVLNRCRKPSNADILVPGDTICLIGTTSTHVGFDEIDNVRVTPDEVKVLLQGGIDLAPSLASTRIIRAYAGVRPLVASDDDPTGRNISRGIVLLDHETRDGLAGFITITGGKLMTYRLMAEWATDLVCKKLHNDKRCQTAVDPLPGSETAEELKGKSTVCKSSIYRHGDKYSQIKMNSDEDNSLVCECEEVSVGEVNYAIDNLDIHNLVDLRHRVRIGMGTCQGALCTCRAAGVLAEKGVYSCDAAQQDIASFVNERWKGISPVGWGDTLREGEYISWVYEDLCGIKETSKND